MKERISLELHSRQQAWQVIKTQLYPFLAQVLQGGHRWVLEVKQSTRSTDQNRRLWMLLTDVSNQVEWYGHKLSPEEWKDVFSASLKRTKVVPGLDGGFVVCGQSTSRMTKSEMSEMQELITAFGSERGVLFKDMDHE